MMSRGRFDEYYSPVLHSGRAKRKWISEAKKRDTDWSREDFADHELAHGLADKSEGFFLKRTKGHEQSESGKDIRRYYCTIGHRSAQDDIRIRMAPIVPSINDERDIIMARRKLRMKHGKGK